MSPATHEPIDYLNAVYLSAYRSDRALFENRQDHKALAASIRWSGFERFEEAHGVYDGKREESYVVNCTNPRGYTALLNLARDYGQESILIVVDGQATLQYTADGRCVPIGKLERLKFDHTLLPDGSILRIAA